jgi:ribosomal protein S18 acetylase RimI-like enzyme
LAYSNIAVVPATPDHSAFLAQVVLSASRSQLTRGPFDVALELSDGEVLDMLPLGAALSDAYTALGHDEAELGEVIGRIEALRRCFPTAPPGTWTVEWVAVDAAHRRRGVCAKLMKEILAKGAERGLRKAQISTYVGNDSAIKTYERAGFRVESERRDPKFSSVLGVPGMITMLRNVFGFTLLIVAAAE